MNSYFLFCEISKSNGITDMNEIDKKYLELKNELDNEMKLDGKKLEDTEFQVILDSIERDINHFYEERQKDKKEMKPKF